jgi:hypothetical protein
MASWPLPYGPSVTWVQGGAFGKAGGGGGRGPGQFYAVHSIVTDTKGNIYTTETYRGQRVQKFVYKGMVPLSSLIKQKVVSGSVINAGGPVSQ